MQTKSGTMSSRIGEGPWCHVLNQSRLSFFEKCWKTTVGDQVSTVRKTNTELMKQFYWWKSMPMYKNERIKY